MIVISYTFVKAQLRNYMKSKLKDQLKSTRKEAKKEIQTRLIGDLKELTVKYGEGSKKLNKKIEKESKQLAKKLSKKLKLRNEQPAQDQVASSGQ
jgi:hypothetical protein